MVDDNWNNEGFPDWDLSTLFLDDFIASTTYQDLSSGGISYHPDVVPRSAPMETDCIDPAFLLSAGLNSPSYVHNNVYDVVPLLSTPSPITCDTGESIHHSDTNIITTNAITKTKITTPAMRAASDRRRKYQPRFSCSICFENFTTKYSRDRHVNVHQGIRFTCNKCPKTFGNPTDCQRHKRRKHMNPLEGL